jgi:hypothetical protein
MNEFPCSADCYLAQFENGLVFILSQMPALRHDGTDIGDRTLRVELSLSTVEHLSAQTY